MYKIAICDDDTTYRDTVKKLIIDMNVLIEDIRFYEFSTGEELLNTNTEFDLLFLDIHMPGMDGNQVAVKFRKYSLNCILVFCTNYQMPLPENFKVSPFRYIMKDIHDKELEIELPEILYAMMEKNKQMYISVTNDGEVFRILNEEILYLTIDGRKTKIVCFNNKETYCVWCREKLKTLYMELYKERFEYVHTSYIVNMSKIIHIEQKEITLINGEKLYISRLKSKDFDQAFTKFLNRKFRR